VNNELERMWKEVEIAQFEAPSRHMPRGIVEYRRHPQSGELNCAGRYLKPAPPEYEAGVLLNLPRRSVG
jgi:hypothetical protein